MKKTRFIMITMLVALLTSAMFANTKIKVALLLDTSNSMDGLIDQAKSQLWKIVNELSHCKYESMQSRLEISLYEYGNDRLPMREGYIRQVTPFTNDLDLISEKLFKLKTNGGSEFCGQVIGVSLKQLEWGSSNDNLKMIFIAGNEPFDQGNISYHEVCKTARENDIIVNTIFCGNFQEGVATNWKDGAYIGGGEYMNIDQDCKYVHIPSPYDDRIFELNEKLNDTYVGFGINGGAYKFRQEQQDANATTMGSESAIQRTLSKSSKAYSNSDWDIIDAYKNNKQIISELKPGELPEEMKSMNHDEQIAYIEKKLEDRNAIATNLSELNTKRNDFIAEKQSNTENSNMLDKVIIEAVRKQAIAKNYSFD